jgi:hypothetical protein
MQEKFNLVSPDFIVVRGWEKKGMSRLEPFSAGARMANESAFQSNSEV